MWVLGCKQVRGWDGEKTWGEEMGREEEEDWGEEKI